MNDRDDNFEQNLGRLLQASYGPETLVTAAARERLRCRLAVALRSRPQPAEFPRAALAALTGLVWLLCAAWVPAAWLGGAGWPGGFPGALVVAVVVANLVVVPVSGLVIVLRRKYV